ncbi:hypothetical protein EYF80_020925 [Liparis tanakae]|uniref:Uncharacterized protein n=1 Tax=Liparis tanakae TaxID=230148 RepID=A0A4Z2HTB2_9TELE|nr:hypothetical protein EYF80_020925 [Liparis tanakae]
MWLKEGWRAASQHRSQHHEGGPGVRGRVGGCHTIQKQLEEDDRRDKGPQQFSSCQALDVGRVEGGQERLQVLGAVVLGVKQQHREQLRGPDPCGHQPVGDVVANGRHQPTQVSDHKLPAAQPWTLHWRRKQRMENSPLCQVRQHVVHVFPSAVLNDSPGGFNGRHSYPGVLMRNRLHQRLNETLSLHLSLRASGKGSTMVLCSMLITSVRYGAKCFPHTSTVSVNISTADSRSSSAGSSSSFSPSL